MAAPVILRWTSGGQIYGGTLRDYIAHSYPLYTKLDLFTWKQILEYLQKEQSHARHRSG